MITKFKIGFVRFLLWMLKKIAEDSEKRTKEMRQQTMSEAFRVMNGRQFKYDEKKNMMRPC